MRSLAIISIAVLTAATGCKSPKEIYIAEHTNASADYGLGEYTITVRAEDPNDLNPEIMSDLIWIQKHIYETVIPDDDGIKHIDIFLAATEDSFGHVCREQTWFGCIDVLEMVDGDINIYFHPDYWRSAGEKVIEYFVHELIHYVSYKIDGSGDGGHRRSEYWGKDGLISIIIEEWKDHRRNQAITNEPIPEITAIAIPVKNCHRNRRFSLSLSSSVIMRVFAFSRPV